MFDAMVPKDWVAWHRAYDEPGSRLSRRLEVVRRHVRAALDGAAPGTVRAISMCAGEGRDLLGVLADHARCDDVRARLVELDDRNAAVARQRAREAGLGHVEVVTADASTTSAYEGAVPAHLVLACGVFGNVADDDIHNTVRHLPGLCAAGAMVIWTRHQRDPGAVPRIDRWFRQEGFDLAGLHLDLATGFAVGAHRLVAPPRPFEPGIRLFAFLDRKE
jgi:hypothetical protein